MFKLEGDPFFPSRWPSLAYQLPHLAEISISDSKIQAQQLHLLELSPVLRKIQLKFRRALKHFLEAIKDDATHFAHLEDLNIADSFGSIEFEAFSRLKSVSSLTALDLVSPGYSGSILDFLPPNLVSLCFISTNIGVVDFHLPRSLEVFKCTRGKNERIVGDLGDLPQGLRAFDFTCWTSKFSAEDIAKLPRGLTSLKAHIESSNPSELAVALPPLLQSFTNTAQPTGEFSEEHMKLLPRSLTYTNAIGIITRQHLEHLPPNLIRISAESSDLGIFSELPSKLQELTLFESSYIEVPDDKEARLTLPNTLTHLSCIASTRVERLILPECLVRLNMEHVPLTTALALLLPRKLESLTAGNCDPECLSTLPRGLKSLQLGEIGHKVLFTAAMAESFPRALGVLRFAVAHLEPVVLSILPTSLDTLYITAHTLDRIAVEKLNAPNLERLRFKLLHAKPGLGDAILAAAPRKLRALQLIPAGPPIMNDISKQSIDNLPRGLIILTIPDSPEVARLDVTPPHLHPALNIRCGSKWIRAQQ